MRQLLRNGRTLFYATLRATVPVVDAQGNETLEQREEWSSPAPLRCNVSAAAGNWSVELFGGHTDYTRTVTFTGSCPLREGDRVWFGVSTDGPHNYLVTRVADGKEEFVVALREVCVGASYQL